MEENASEHSKIKPISHKSDVIEIPVGKYFGKVRENPWIIVTFAFAIALVVAIVYGGSGGVGAQQAGNNLVNFINSQGQGTAFLISSEKEGELYKVVVNFQGEEIPVYTTLDGEFLVSGVIPLSVTGGGDFVGDSGGGSVTPGQINPDDDAFLGNVNAPITIIEFSDYQCPFCQRFWSETLPSLKREYIDTGLVRLVYRDYPLDTNCNPYMSQQLHPVACKAAEAAECVREQGGNVAYFEYHDVLFARQSQITLANLKVWSGELGYNIDSCLDSGKYAEEVINDVHEGGSSLGTPTFFVNGVKLEGAVPFANFKQVIDSQLAAL